MFFNVPFKEIHVNVKPTARTNKSLCMCLPGFYCEGTASCETESKVSGGNGTDSGGLLLEGCVVLVLKQKKASEEVLRMKRMMKRTEFVLALLFVFQVSHDALGQQQQVKAYVGDKYVSLPCDTEPLASNTDPSARWTRGESSPETVHFRDSTGDHLRDQSRTFSGRTRMNPDALQTGNLALDLLRPNISDSGVYICLARGGGTEVGRRTVKLEVKVRPDPGPDPGPIIGGVVGGVVALTALVLVAAVFKRKKSSEETFRTACGGVICCRPRTVL